jgi:hypothetical protein
LTGSVDFSAWQGCHPQPRATYRLRSCRSCARETNSSLEDDQNSLRSDHPALFGEIITRRRGCHERLVAGKSARSARDLAPLDLVWIAGWRRKEKKRVGAQKGPHSSLPVGVFTSSFRVNRSLSLCLPPSSSCPSRPRGLSLSRRFHSTVSTKRAGPRSELGKARSAGPHPLRGYPAYAPRYVAGSAPGASNTARRRSLNQRYSDRKKASKSALWMAGRLKNRFRT